MAAGFICKQFVISHEHCAMKVNTDSFILGSWSEAPMGGRALDIGCGSGILSLMLRQRMGQGSRVEALDIDEGAVHQTRQNVAACPWPDDITVFNADVRHQDIAGLFDVIVCNPPYFANGQVGSRAHLMQSQSRQQARQQDSLSADELFGISANLISEQGTLQCLYPTAQAAQIIEQAGRHGWCLQRQLTVIPKPDKPSHVTAFDFSRHPVSTPQLASLLIRDADNQYSQAYRALCRPFYLAF